MWSSTRKRQLTTQEMKTLEMIQRDTDRRDSQKSKSLTNLTTIVDNTQPNDPKLFEGIYSNSANWTKEEIQDLATRPLVPLGPADVTGKYHLRSIKHPFPVPGSQLLKEKERMATALAKKLSIGLKVSSSDPILKQQSSGSKSTHNDCLHTLESGKLHFAAQSILNIFATQEDILQQELAEREHRLVKQQGSNEDLTKFWQLLHTGRTREAAFMLSEEVFLDINLSIVYDTVTKSITIDPSKNHCLATTPLMAACRLLNVDIVSALIQRNADPNIPNGNGDIALHFIWRNLVPKKTLSISMKWTIEAKKASVILLALLGHGALANTTNSFQETALHMCAKLGINEAVHALLDHGADPRIPDRCGKTALDYAKEQSHLDSYSIMANYHLINQARFRQQELQEAKTIYKQPGQMSLAWSTPPTQMLQEMRLASHRAAYLRGNCITKDGNLILAPDEIIEYN